MQPCTAGGRLIREGTCLWCRRNGLKHGHAQEGAASQTYNAWKAMLARCRNRKNPSYANYGKRGIKVCARWRSFPNFLEDMGEAPSGLTLQRKENDKGYDKDNCTWDTRRAQTRNRRCTVRFRNRNTGEVRTAVEWCEGVSIGGAKLSIQLFTYRVRMGMSIQEALTRPIDSAGSHRDRSAMATLEYKGERLTYAQWEARKGIGRATIIKRRRMGWSPEEILETPVRRRA